MTKETIRPPLPSLVEQSRVTGAIGGLPPRWQDVLDLLYPQAGQPQTLAQTGRDLGISGERVGQIKAKALQRLVNPPVIDDVDEMTGREIESLVAIYRKACEQQGFTVVETERKCTEYREHIWQRMRPRILEQQIRSRRVRQQA